MVRRACGSRPSTPSCVGYSAARCPAQESVSGRLRSFPAPSQVSPHFRLRRLNYFGRRPAGTRARWRGPSHRSRRRRAWRSRTSSSNAARRPRRRPCFVRRGTTLTLENHNVKRRPPWRRAGLCPRRGRFGTRNGARYGYAAGHSDAREGANFDPCACATRIREFPSIFAGLVSRPCPPPP